MDPRKHGAIRPRMEHANHHELYGKSSPRDMIRTDYSLVGIDDHTILEQKSSHPTGASG